VGFFTSSKRCLTASRLHNCGGISARAALAIGILLAILTVDTAYAQTSCPWGGVCPTGSYCGEARGQCVADGRVECGTYSCEAHQECAPNNQCMQATTAPPQPSAPTFGAFAYDRSTLSWGQSWSFSDQRGADQRALQECGTGNCQIVLETSAPLCGAISIGMISWGVASRPSLQDAQLAALANCQQYGGECYIVGSHCN
jgi:hypothetical protein